MNLPDLQALQAGDADAWDEAFRWLWPVAFGAARKVLQSHLPDDAEDTAVRGIEELVDKVKQLKSGDELRPLVASIAHNLAVSRLRQHFADKREGGKTESLEARQEECGDL